MKSYIDRYKYYLLQTVKFHFILLLFIFFASCSKQPEYEEYLIQVDSLTIIYPDAFLYSGLFEINLYGTISPNGCSSFSHFNISRQNQDVIIEAWKSVHINATVCPAVMVYLNHNIRCNRDTLPETFIIKVKQPDGSFLEKQMK